jgi:serine/threonine protein kinase
MIGESIAHYRVTARLGAGGMGEVYRATDTKLGRDVALKVLPQAFVQDPQRMARFQREAQMLALLNHPHIAAIYGLEVSGATNALAMELVDGPTLAERIGGGAVPVEEALPLARQIADALEYAHEKGIIHRDLKPANIKLTRDGQVKVLDFGLAKALAEDSAVPDVSNSPTLSVAATKAGFILGTAAYMAPEQAKGKAVDRRADVWAFGCVLYEMLTGARPFPGEDVSETLAAVIRGEPDWKALPANLPAPIDRLVKRCLQKDMKRRLQAIGEARVVLEDCLANPTAAQAAEAASAVASVPVPAARTARAAWTIATISTVATLALAALYFGKPSDQPVIRAFIPAPEKTHFNASGRTDSGPVSVSPDGRMLVFAAISSDNKQQLWIRAIDSLSAQPLPGTEGGAYPFWSPDSRTVGFFAERKLKRIAVAGGPAVPLCEAPEGRGGTWNQDGTIVFAPNRNGLLHKVPEAGGNSTVLAHLGPAGFAGTQRWPSFLPDGRHFLFATRRAATGTFAAAVEGDGVVLGSLDSAPPKSLLPIMTNASYAAGHLLFVRDGTLMAQPFDLGKLQFSGDAFPVAEKVLSDALFVMGTFSVSQNGVLAYQEGESQGHSRLHWYDRTGKVLGVLGDEARYFDLALSRDGKRVAVNLSSGSLPDIWTYDVARGLRTRFSFDPGSEGRPVWSPDGSRVVFTLEGQTVVLLQKSFAGAGKEEIIPFPEGQRPFASSWSSDGRFLASESRGNVQTGRDIWVIPMTGERKPIPFLITQFHEGGPMFSPDGRWIAYQSNESGRDEVYVAPFPGPGRKWQVSTTGGNWPKWRGDGKEILYVGADLKITAVEVGARGDTFEIGKVQPLFDTTPVLVGAFYDVSQDGRRFLVNTIVRQTSSQPITLVVNWAAALKK